MKLDSIKQFSKLRDSLVAERTQLQNRLSQIDEALGSSAPSLTNGVSRRGRGRGRGGLSLKAAIIQATAKKALTKEEILHAVKKAGVRFGTRRPMATLNAYLYQRGKFVRKDGRFTATKA